jgi:hypothetical protein
MSPSEEGNRVQADATGRRTAKKPYRKPAVRYEKVFETRALTCGKVQPTQAQCAHNRRTS